MTDFWPEDWRIVLAKVFDSEPNRITVRVVLVDSEGNRDDEPIVFRCPKP